MLLRKVTASAKGQLTLPVAMLRSMGAKGPVELLLIQEADRIVIVRPERVAKAFLDDVGGWQAIAEPAFREVWDDEANTVWDDA